MKQTITLEIYDFYVNILEVYEVDNQLIVISNCGERTSGQELITSQITVNTNSDIELPVNHYAFGLGKATYILAVNSTIEVIRSLSDVYELNGKNLNPLPVVEAEKMWVTSADFSTEEECNSENLGLRI